MQVNFLLRQVDRTIFFPVSKKNIVDESSKILSRDILDSRIDVQNPYGDGLSASRIFSIVVCLLDK